MDAKQLKELLAALNDPAAQQVIGREVVESTLRRAGRVLAGIGPEDLKAAFVIKKGEVVPSSFSGFPGLTSDSKGQALEDWTNGTQGGDWERMRPYNVMWALAGPFDGELPSNEPIDPPELSPADFNEQELRVLEQYGIEVPPENS